MDKITKDLQKVSGIYCIENKINTKKYIGSSTNIYQRLLKHFAQLRHNHHENSYLQNSWNKYGEENFRWFILEVCIKEDLEKREQYYINNLNSDYNITRIVERNQLSKESRIKQGETRRRLHQEGKLEWNFNPVPIFVYNLEGKLLFKVDEGLKATAKKLHISPSSICRVTNGTYQQCKGYRFSYKEETLAPLVIRSNKQKTKYNNYTQCLLSEQSE